MPIFDQGYQHWKGDLAGHAWRWLAITQQGVRTGMKNRWVRIVMLVAWLPAIGLGFMLCLWGMVEKKSDLVMPIVEMLSFLQPLAVDPHAHRLTVWTLCFDYFLWVEMYFSMILVLMIGPSLISQDLRFNALPLYFSRPLRRIDYFMGKLGVIGYFLGQVVIVPALLAYFLGLLFSLDITIIRDTYHLLLSSIAYGLVIILSAGLFILALSSLSRNSRYVALFWIVIWSVSGMMALALNAVDQNQRRQDYYRKAYSNQPIVRSNPQNLDPQEQRRQQQEQQRQQNTWMEKMQKAEQEFQAEQFEAKRHNWRPLLSFTANLYRVGAVLLDTDDCWIRMSKLKPPNERERFLNDNQGPQYPWYWSAGVLAVLIGLSLCILNFRVKSLDRLR
jgi:ABC-2 type transport system permease protein